MMMENKHRKPAVVNPEFEEAVKDMVRGRKPTPYERTRDAVCATGNKWAKENFDATHN